MRLDLTLVTVTQSDFNLLLTFSVMQLTTYFATLICKSKAKLIVMEVLEQLFKEISSASCRLTCNDMIEKGVLHGSLNFCLGEVPY